MTDMAAQFRSTYPVITDLVVQWGEMDALQHVNNVNYFRYFETVRIQYMMQTSLLQGQQGVGPVLAETECRYKRPVTFPDTLTLGCRVSAVQAHGFVQEYAIFSQAQQAITTLGSARIVVVDLSTGAKAALPESVVAQIEAIEARR